MKNLMFVGKGWKVRRCRSDRCKSVSDEMTLCRVACREPEKISRRSIPKKEVTSHVLLKVAGWIAFTLYVTSRSPGWGMPWMRANSDIGGRVRQSANVGLKADVDYAD